MVDVPPHPTEHSPLAPTSEGSQPDGNAAPDIEPLTSHDADTQTIPAPMSETSERQPELPHAPSPRPRRERRPPKHYEPETGLWIEH